MKISCDICCCKRFSLVSHGNNAIQPKLRRSHLIIKYSLNAQFYLYSVLTHSNATILAEQFEMAML